MAPGSGRLHFELACEPPGNRSFATMVLLEGAGAIPAGAGTGCPAPEALLRVATQAQQ